ncbi:MAG TPA: ABC transporter permease [Acidimicrobiales bacterium]
MSTLERAGNGARIVDRSYRPYDGPRGGVRTAVFATAKHSVQRALGIKRTMWQKVLPIVSVGIAYVPAIVFIGVAALNTTEGRINDVLPSYSEYYGFITAAIVVFTAFVAPEVLSTDRRTGMLGLYLASPLDRNTYLLSKAAAVGFVLSIVTVGPLLLMLIAYTILGEGPDGPDDWLITLVRILLGGLGISAVHTSLSLAVSSFTTRRAAASATIALILFGSLAVVGALVESADWPPNIIAFDLFELPFLLVTHIFGEGNELDIENPAREMTTWLVYAANVAWTFVFATIVWWRYRKLAVTR